MVLAMDFPVITTNKSEDLPVAKRGKPLRVYTMPVCGVPLESEGFFAVDRSSIGLCPSW